MRMADSMLDQLKIGIFMHVHNNTNANGSMGLCLDVHGETDNHCKMELKKAV